MSELVFLDDGFGGRVDRELGDAAECKHCGAGCAWWYTRHWKVGPASRGQDHTALPVQLEMRSPAEPFCSIQCFERRLRQAMLAVAA